MSAAVCLLASLLSCPYPDTGARLQPSTGHTPSIKRERLGKLPTPIVARFGPDERFGPTNLQIPIQFIFSKVDKIRELEDQEQRYEKRREIKVSVDKPSRNPKTRTKIILETTQTRAVNTAYAGPTPLEDQWRVPLCLASPPPPPYLSPACPVSI